MRIQSTVFAAALLGLLGVPVRATTVLFDQSPTNGQPTNGNQFSITTSRLADDFTLANQSTVTDLLFYYTAQFTSDLGAVTYAIYANSTGTLGTVLGSGTIASGSITRAGQSSPACGNCASASFSIAPLPLAGGSYWLEVHNGTSLTDTMELEVDWAAVSDNATLIALTDNGSGMTPSMPVPFGGYQQYAFQVLGTTVPEPGTITLLAVGLSILAVIARRRRRPVTPVA